MQTYTITTQNSEVTIYNDTDGEYVVKKTRIQPFTEREQVIHKSLHYILPDCIPQIIRSYAEDEHYFNYIRKCNELTIPITEMDVRQMIALVHQLHLLGISHCDISPHNFMRKQDGKIVIIDFGNATLIGTLQSYTGFTCPSPNLRKLHKNWIVDITEDIWALGSSIYYLTYGKWLSKSYSPSGVRDDVILMFGSDSPSKEEVKTRLSPLDFQGLPVSNLALEVMSDIFSNANCDLSRYLEDEHLSKMKVGKELLIASVNHIYQNDPRIVNLLRIMI